MIRTLLGLGILLLDTALADSIPTITWQELGRRTQGRKVVVSLRTASAAEASAASQGSSAVQGKVVRWDAQRLTLQEKRGAPLREVMRSDIELVRVEPHRGRKGRLIGAGVGLVIGAASAFPEATDRAGTQTGTIIANAVVTAGIGALVGWGVDAIRTSKTVLYRVARDDSASPGSSATQ